MGFTIHRHLGVPHFLDEVIYVLVGKATILQAASKGFTDMIKPILYFIDSLVNDSHTVLLYGIHYGRYILHLIWSKKFKRT